VTGKLETDNGQIRFNYGKNYLERIKEAKPVIPIYEPELPLKPGILALLEGLNIPGCIRDAAPDAWGRRVIINKKLGSKGAGTDTAELDELTYLLESGSDRISALDFQHSPPEYVPRSYNNASLEELLESAERIEKTNL
jgi:serine/threonine-protein kinase HipA